LGTKFGGSIGGKEFEACMRQLNQDSLSFSNTLPGGAADAVLARQSINVNYDSLKFILANEDYFKFTGFLGSFKLGAS